MKLWFKIGALTASGIAVGPLFAPNLLAFPYQAQVGRHQVYSVTPLPATIEAVVRNADRKVGASPSGSFRASDQPIFLTGGGGDGSGWQQQARIHSRLLGRLMMPLSSTTPMSQMTEFIGAPWSATAGASRG